MSFVLKICSFKIVLLRFVLLFSPVGFKGSRFHYRTNLRIFFPADLRKWRFGAGASLDQTGARHGVGSVGVPGPVAELPI